MVGGWSNSHLICKKTTIRLFFSQGLGWVGGQNLSNSLEKNVWTFETTPNTTLNMSTNIVTQAAKI